MLCFRCGSPVSDTAQTCANCGQDLSSQAAPNPEQFAELQKKLRETGREQRRPTAACDIGEVVAERYEINDVVGVGAVGTVYKAFDQESEVDVALKVISSEHLPSEEARNHFLLALQRARDVVHDNAVRYFDVDHDGQRCFYVMQFLKGLPLRKILDMRRAKGQRFSVAEVEPIFVQMCKALDDTSAIMVHGGLKPENIIILPDLLKITDFGLAEVLPREAFLAAQRHYKDALHYIAPEVVARADYDVRADIYSVGVVLVELLTGRVYTGDEPVAIHAKVEEIPQAVDEVLQRAVSHDPEERQATPGQLSVELADALGVKGVVVPGAVEPEVLEPPEPPPDDDEETTSRARLQSAAELTDDNVATGEIEGPELALERPDYSDPLVPPPKKSGSQVTHQLGIDDIELVSQSGPVGAVTDGLGPDEEEDDILTDPPVEERTARVDPDQMQEQVAETEEELRLSKPEGPPPERTQQIDPDMIIEGEGAEEEDAEQVLLVPPGDINHSQVSGETDSDPMPEPADEPSYKPLSANLSQKVLSQDSINKEARAREALQAFDFDATLQEAVEKAHQVEPDESGSGAVPLPKGEELDPRPNVVTSEAALSARGTLEVPAAPAQPPVVDEDEGQTMVVAQEAVVDRPPTNRLLPTLIVAFIVVLAAGTAGAIYYVSNKRTADALQELERKRAAALALVKDSGAKAVVTPDTGPAVAALPLSEDASPPATPDSAVSAEPAPPPPPPPEPTPRPAVKQAPRPAIAKTHVVRPRPAAPRVTPPPPPPPAPAPAPKASSGKCPSGMRHITGRGGGEGYCIDRHEYPGRGRVPQRAGLQAAAAACRARGLRLCTAKEWIRACGGLFPYGRTYNAKRCNTGGSALVPAGSRPGCRSRWGLFDMSGNVSEWVADGVAMGGDARSEQGHAGCLARTGGGGLTGFRCCGDPEWD